MRLANTEPRLEGEGSPSPPLYRTGSDGDITLNNSHYFQTDMLKGIEVGPHLRLAKSSSLESLQTVMHYTIHADGGLQGDGNIRRFVINNSFFVIERDGGKRAHDPVIINFNIIFTILGIEALEIVSEEL